MFQQRSRPKGHGSRWKTGQRVPFTGWWTDQYGVVSHHVQHGTFPPCIGRKGECALRVLDRAVRTA